MKPAKQFFLFVFFILLHQTIFSQVDFQKALDTTMYGRNEQVGKYIKTRGFNMYYEVYGSGAPMLIIHGNGGSINNFVFQIPYFSQNYRVILADSRAQGISYDFSDSLSYEMMADDLNALLDSLHVDSCYVIGWSDGGINGLLLAMRHPDKVKKLAITGANLSPDTSAVDPFVWQWARSEFDTIKKMPQDAMVKNATKLMNLLTNEPHIASSDLAKIQCPVLVIGGDHDVIRTKHTLLIAESLPHAYLWILPNSGHATPIFYKDMFNKVVGDFFKTPYREIDGMGRFD